MSASANPACPNCGEPVGSTSTYCMHCDAEFDAPAGTVEAGDARDAGTGRKGDGGRGGDARTASATPASVDDYGTTGEGYDGDHPLDDAARLVGVSLALLLGLAATVTVVLAFAQRPNIWLPLALVALAGTIGLGVHVSRFDTGRGALTRSLYVAAGGLVVLPIAFFLLVGDTSMASRVILSAAAGGLGVVLAVPTALVGYWLSPDRA